jgi:TonB family protein
VFEGWAIVKALIDTSGSALDIDILESSGNSLWNEIAINTIKETKFDTITLDNIPVKAWMLIPIKFSIKLIKSE